jgi:hypothetical protein
MTVSSVEDANPNKSEIAYQPDPPAGSKTNTQIRPWLPEKAQLTRS